MTLQDCVIQRIFGMCIQADWTIKQLAEKSGVSPAALESLLHQERAEMTLEQLCAICRAFSISLPEFFDTASFRRLFSSDAEHSKK